jgi:hypothetical protein
MKSILTPAAVTSSLKTEVLISSGTLQVSSQIYGFTKQLSLQCIHNILLITKVFYSPTDAQESCLKKQYYSCLLNNALPDDGVTAPKRVRVF